MSAIECAHCGDPVDLPDLLVDGDTVWCDNCGGPNTLSVDRENEPDFLDCDALPCRHCYPEDA